MTQWDPHDDHFDPAALADEAIRSNLDPSVFEKIDDRDIRRPVNWFEWCFDRNFLNVTPFPKQVEICVNFFGQFCPRCTDPQFMETDKLGHRRLLIEPVDCSLGAIQERIVFLQNGVCPRCHVQKPELLAKKELNHYYNLCGAAGMRSSKTVMTAGLIGTYQLARMLLIPSPSKYFGLLEDQTLHGTFCAITAGQAYETLWQAFKDRIGTAPWFQQYHAFLGAEALRLNKEKFYEVKDTFVWYAHKKLSCSYSGPDIRTIRGRTRFMCVEGKTLVYTKDGIFTMKELSAGRPLDFSSLDVEVLTENRSARSSQFYSAKKSRIVRIVTRHGYEIAGTPVHPIRILQEDGLRRWQMLDDVQCGQSIVLRKAALFSITPWKFPRYEVVGPHVRYRLPDSLDSDLAWLFGILIAEGTIWYKGPQDGGFSFFTADQDIFERARRIFLEKFGGDLKYERVHNGWRPVCQSPRVGRWLIEAGVCGNSHTKDVPISILRSPRSIVASFIRGYFDGDGHSEDSHIAITSASEELLRKVHVLLLGFGVVAYRKAIHRKEGNYWMVRICGSNIERFHAAIGFSVTRKQPKAPTERNYGADEKIPIDPTLITSKHIPNTYQYLCHDGSVRKVFLSSFTTFFRRCRTRPMLQRVNLEDIALINPALSNNIQDILQREDLYYDEVVDKSEETGETFDLTIPDEHSFVANGIISHNTSIDEIGWFDVQAEATAQNVKVRLNAKETHEALIKSLRTVRSASAALRAKGEIDPIDGLNADVSSPSSINDAIMVGLREANEDPTIYAFHYATWEMNPYVPLDSLRSEMRNRSVFERDYEAIPPLGVNQFMSNQVSVEKCQKDAGQHRMISWDKKIFNDEFGDKTMYLEVKPIVQDRNRPRILVIDTGLANNCFAVEMWSYDRELKMPVCDIALECMPEGIGDDRILVNFPLMYEKCVVPLLTSYRVILVVYDRWNSVDQVQRIRKDHKVEAVQYTLKWADFLQVRARLIDSSIRIPKLEVPIEEVRKSDRQFEEIIRPIPVTHMALQILTVREAGRKVVKPINGNDDLFRCLCLALRFILDPAYTSKFEQYGVGFMGTRGSIGAMRSNRGGSSQVVQHERNQNAMIGVRRSFIQTLK